MEDIIIDYGKWVIPDGWDKLTLRKYQEIERYYDGKDKDFDVREVLHILTDHDVDEINALPLEFLDMVMSKLEWLQGKPEEKEPTNSVVINGEEYTVHVENKLKVGEYVASDTILKGDKHNYAALLAILCRKDGEIYDSKFENEVLPDRIKMWEETPVTDVLPIIGFFLQLYGTLMMPTLLSSKVEDMLNLIAKDIETSQKNGEISKRCMNLRMKKLKKLKKSISST